MNSISLPSRLTELDWLRILALGLLILYHMGMFYVSWDWHVKSPRLVPALEVAMRWVNPWRMSLLFVVSGAATGLMLRSGRSLARQRSLRLGLPLLFGMAVVVPPQAYMEVMQKWHYSGSYLEFLGLYFSRYKGFCDGPRCLVLPTWNHLWFLPYLWLYTLILAGVVGVWGVGVVRHRAWSGLAHPVRMLCLPILLLAVFRIALVERFPATHDLIHDAYYHALYASMFVLGLGLFGHRDDAHAAWAAVCRCRWWALAVALAALGVQRAVFGMWSWGELPSMAHVAMHTLTATLQWAPIVAALGFGRKWLSHRDVPALRWLTQGVFTFYIIHQSAIVVLAPWLARQGLPLPVEMLLLLLCTLACCVLVFGVARRLPGLAICLGVQGASGPNRATMN